MTGFQKALILAVFFTVCLTGMLMSSVMAQPGPGPGPGPPCGMPPCGGPPDPPRDTPGLDPVTLGLLATGGFAGYQYFKNKPGKPQA